MRGQRGDKHYREGDHTGDPATRNPSRAATLAKEWQERVWERSKETRAKLEEAH